MVSTQSDSPGKANFCRHPIWNTQWAPIIKHNCNNGTEILILGLLHDTLFTSLSPLQMLSVATAGSPSLPLFPRAHLTASDSCPASASDLWKAPQPWVSFTSTPVAVRPVRASLQAPPRHTRHTHTHRAGAHAVTGTVGSLSTDRRVGASQAQESKMRNLGETQGK